jgi:hypothetical protein
MTRRIADSKFRMFFAVHEYEAWLLSDPAVFPPSIRDRRTRDGRTPENVDDNEPPAKLLDRLYEQNLNRPYRKTVDSVQLFRDLDPNVVYDKCPNFKRLADTMLEMAQSHVD